MPYKNDQFLGRHSKLKMKAFILLSLVGCAMAAHLHNPRIVGGSPVDISEYPYMSNMQYSWIMDWWYHSCGGSLITINAVLSAAHCYHGDAPESWRVLLGSSSVSNEDVIHYVAQLIVHSDFDPTILINDVAIVILKEPAVLSKTINVAMIAGPDYKLPDDEVVTSIGWGALSSGGQSPDHLQHVEVNVINQEICAARYLDLQATPGHEGWPNVTSGMLCLGILDEGGKDACQGDSGGPVAHKKNIVVGITSWGYGCAHPKYPGVNTRVSEYTGWIVANAELID